MTDDINARLAVAEARIEAECEASNASREHVANRMERVEHLLLGNGTGSGVLTRLDRIEQMQKSARWFFGVLTVAVLKLVLDSFIEVPS